MSDDTTRLITNELGPDECLLWSGRPRLGFALRPSDAFLIPFSILWGGFAIFWEATVIATGAPVFFVLWGIPFVLVGLYLIFGRFWVDAKQRAATYYGITDERVMIMSGLISRTTKSFNLDTLSCISLTEKADGSGTIALGPQNPWYGWMGQSNWPGVGQYSPPAIEMVDNARQIYETIRDAQREARNAG